MTNSTDAAFDAASLSLALPFGVSFFDAPQDQSLMFRELGRINEGERRDASFDLIVYDTSAFQSEARASLNYALSGVTSRFEKQESFKLPEAGQGIVLTLTPQDEINEGVEFPLEIAYENFTDTLFPSVALRIEVPENVVVRSTLPQDPESHDFLLGDLRPKSKGTATIMVTVLSEAPGALLRATLATDFRAQFSRRVSEWTFPLSMTASPLTVDLSVNDNPDFVAAPDASLLYTFEWSNIAETAFENASVRVTLIGDTFDFGTIETDGIWNAANRTVTWDPTAYPELARIPPKATGKVQFSIRTLPTYPIRRLGDFVLRADAQLIAQGAGVSSNVPIIRVARLETKVRGEIAVNAFAVFRDAASGILNTGTVPLRAGERTDFTVHWAVRNFSTDMSGVRIRAALGERASFTNVYDNRVPGTTLSYDERTRTVTWEIPTIAATRGVIDAPLEAVFQISVTPSDTDLGRPIILLQDITVGAQDDFIGLPFERSYPALRTTDLNDPTVGQDDRIVVP